MKQICAYFLSLFLLASFCTAFADIHVSMGNKIIHIMGESQSDKSKGNLTSFFSNSFSGAITARINSKLNLSFNGLIDVPNFSTPAGRKIKQQVESLKVYSLGFHYKKNETRDFIFTLAFQDIPYYFQENQNEINVVASNNLALSLGIRQVSDWLTPLSFSLSVLALSPILSEYDSGRVGYGFDILVEKELHNEDYTYCLQANVGSKYFSMKKVTLQTDEVGIRFLVKIPIRSKK